jgi:hypothetical protein
MEFFWKLKFPKNSIPLHFHSSQPIKQKVCQQRGHQFFAAGRGVFLKKASKYQIQ